MPRIVKRAAILSFSATISSSSHWISEKPERIIFIIFKYPVGPYNGSVWPGTKDLNQLFINALIVIAARNTSKFKPNGIKEHADKKTLEIINYIQSNIYLPEQLKAAVICNMFGISPNYLSVYFKEQCGETISSFIANYRLRLIEYRLSFSDTRINELVDEFGFSDESHMNKFFKRHKKMSMGAYRRNSFTIL